MRAFHLLLTVVLFMTTFAENVEQRSLQVGDNNNTEERGITDVMSGIKAKLLAAKAKINQGMNENKIYRMIKQGEDQDTIFAKMGVDPVFIDVEGRKYYDPRNPLVQSYDDSFIYLNPQENAN